MGSVLLHAGMPKTGSTSIQVWLKENVGLVRARGLQVILDASSPGGGDYRFELLGDAPLSNANVFLVRYAAARDGDPAERVRLATEFAAALAAAADSHDDVVLTSEGFAVLIQSNDRPFLDALDWLGRRHRVTVAQYVRPQDSALEARWRQWGFWSHRTPSDWVLQESEDLRYAEAHAAVTAADPAFTFDVRPFRADLLPAGGTVVDFARHFLGIEDPPPVPRMNPGLPLDLANLLRLAPGSLLDPPARADGRGWRQGELAVISRDWAIPESDEAVAARAVLRQYASDEFEAANLELVRALGWATDHFISPAQTTAWSGATQAELLSELDRLWTPQASPSVLAHLFAALGELWQPRARL